MSRIRVLLADKNEVYREGLIRLLRSIQSIEIVAACKTGYEAIEYATKYKPDVLVIDAELSDCSSLQAIRNITQQSPKTNIIMLAFLESVKYVVLAVKAGIVSYLSRDISLANLVNAITLVAESNVAIFPRTALEPITEPEAVHIGAAARLFKRSGLLSRRETEVLTLVSDGCSNEDAAAKLSISKNTVKVHMQRVMGKLNAKNRQEAVAWAIAKGLIQRNLSDVGIN